MAEEETMNGAQIVLNALQDQGVGTVFGYPGGAVLPIYDELFKQNRIRHVLVRQEGGAVHAAEGYARSTGKVGVVLVTSGPGATNAVTGLTDAMLDSVPLVCFSGQVPTHLIGNDAFQEADTTGITRPASKHNYLAKSTNSLARIVHEAFYVARSGRPGPVLIDLPKNVQIGTGPYLPPEKVRHKTYRPRTAPEPARLEEAAEMMAKAKRPVFYCGGGVINSDAYGPDRGTAVKRMTEFIRATGFPVTLTMMGLGAYPASDLQFLGMLGMHGTYEANMAMHDCDLMITVGARFDDRITGRLDAFSPNSKKIQIDIDPSSINKNVAVDLPIAGDASLALEGLLTIWREKRLTPDTADLKKWWESIEEWRSKKCLSYQKRRSVIKPQQAIRRLRSLADEEDLYITTEVGQHQMWTCQHGRFEEPYRWMTSGGLGTMGYGLPAAVGVQAGHPDSLVVCIAGESSLMMNIQELATAVQHKLPIKIMVLDNHYMGMVRQWQELFYDSRYSQTNMESMPDLVKLAEAFGATGMRVENPAELDEAIRGMIAAEGPVLLDVAVDPAENCYPMIPPGEAHNHMWLGPAQDGDTSPGEDDVDGMVLV